MSIELTTISNSLNGPEKIDKVLTQVRLTCTSVSKERDVPGQTGTGRPVIPLSRDKKNCCPSVPLSWDKGRSKCPGTNSSVPGKNDLKIFKKKGPDFPF